MTAMQLFCLASIGAALLFFAAGAVTMELRRHDAPPSPRTLQRRLEAAEAAHRATDAELATLRANAWVTADELVVVRDKLATAAATVREQQLVLDDQATVKRQTVDLAQVQTIDDDRARLLAGELDRARNDAATFSRELDHAQARLREAEQQLGERAHMLREFSTQNEQLKGRVRDADGIRADYVRLRTSAIESEFLKTEVTRLEGELRAMKIDALGGQRRRPARGSVRPTTPSNRSIGESLATVIERFSDTGTRSSAIADSLGFPLAISGDDGMALAAYAALLVQAANRGKEFLPVGAPVAIEMIDEHGVRISVWTFNVEHDRLLLVNLAVTPADAGRVEAALSDLTAILTPTALASASHA